MLVNELAKKAGVDTHVVRYYTRIGLLQPQRNPENGYQLFGREDRWRLEKIRALQALGFSLGEIKNFLEHAPDCSRVRSGLQHNIVRNRRKLAELIALQNRMEAAIHAWGSPHCSNPLCAGCCTASGGAGGLEGALDLCAAHSR